MTTAQSQITTRPEPETVNSRFVVVPPRPSCRPDSSTIASAAVEPPGSRIENPESSSLIQQSSNPVIQPTQRKLTRNGKVARLTHLQRDMVNRMLRNNLSHDKIVGALAEHDVHVTRRNISNWKTRGGYKEWCLEQDRAVETRLFQENLMEYLRKHDASQLPEIGLQLAATHLSEFFVKPETRQQLASSPEKFAKTLAILCRLAGQIQSLQKYRDDSARELGYKHNPERIKREAEEEIEITRNVYSSYIPPNAPIDPEVPHRNFLPKS